VTAPALLIAGKVSNLTDAIADVVELLGNEDTRRLLVTLAEGLGAPEEEFGPERVGARPEPGRPRE
jgi:hypothetical protein